MVSFLSENRLFIFELKKSTPVSSAEVGAVHLNQGLRQAIIDTKLRHGTVQMSPVWYLWEGRQLIFATSTEAVKYSNLQRIPA